VPEWALDRIVIGDRVRKDMGDLASFAESIKHRGLLHPIVVTPDGALVAGHRRIEAVRLLGGKKIAVTVVDVADLLSAERDENTERKDWTESEAVAIGRLIEEQERPGAAARTATGRSYGRKGKGELDSNLTASSKHSGEVAAIAAKAVGMSKNTYLRARAVVAAAEAEPGKYGDLPARMDETGNVSGTHDEMQHRKNGTAGRHAVHYKKRYPKTNDMIRRAVDALEGICSGLSGVKVEEADAVASRGWSKALEGAAAQIRRFARRLKNVKK